MKKKGLHCCGFRYQHTYNGKLTEGRGDFVCISTILDLYFLWGRIGQLSRGSNRTHVVCHVRTTGLRMSVIFTAKSFPSKLKLLCTSNFDYWFSLEEISLNPVFLRLPCLFANVTFCISMKLLTDRLEISQHDIHLLLRKVQNRSRRLAWRRVAATTLGKKI